MSTVLLLTYFTLPHFKVSPFSLTLLTSYSLSLSLSLTLSDIQTMQLFIFLNSVNHICNALSECSKWLELDPFYDWLEERQKIGKSCKRSVEKIIQETQEVIHSCVTNNVMLEIKKKVHVYTSYYCTVCMG